MCSVLNRPPLNCQHVESLIPKLVNTQRDFANIILGRKHSQRAERGCGQGPRREPVLEWARACVVHSVPRNRAAACHRARGALLRLCLPPRMADRLRFSVWRGRARRLAPGATQHLRYRVCGSRFPSRLSGRPPSGQSDCDLDRISFSRIPLVGCTEVRPQARVSQKAGGGCPRDNGPRPACGEARPPAPLW